ncbi:MAG: hypothetical protein ACHP7E_09635, partial [Burkholderiales bacterium]
TLAADRCARAEVAAKVAFVLGAERGTAFLRQHGLAGLLVRARGAWVTVDPWPAAHMVPTLAAAQVASLAASSTNADDVLGI